MRVDYIRERDRVNKGMVARVISSGSGMVEACVTGRLDANAPDDELIRLAQNGGVEAFGLLYERHKDSVYSLALNWTGSREDAEDIVQEAFCRAWRSISGFRRDAKFLTWLYRITANVRADHARRTGRVARLGTRVAMDDDEPLVAPNARCESADSVTRCVVDDALQRLPESHRMIVVLCDIHGFTAKETAQIMGCSQMSVRVRLYRARKHLRVMLADMVSGVDSDGC